jgi:CRP/FNR family transcriptional regulator, cyclic AMP receptor protein
MRLVVRLGCQSLQLRYGRSQCARHRRYRFAECAWPVVHRELRHVFLLQKIAMGLISAAAHSLNSRPSAFTHTNLQIQMPRAQASIAGLRSVRLVGDLPVLRLEAIARQCAWRRYEEGQAIILRNAPERDVYLIIGGRVRINIYSASGRQVIFRDLEAGDIVGDIAAIDDGPRSLDAVALEDVFLASMSPADFKRLLLEEPSVAERYLRRMAGLVRQLTERLVEVSTLAVQVRIHAALLQLAQGAGVQSNAARISPAPTHVEIASQVSTTREQVTRELSAMTRAGLVAKERGALLVKDVAALQRMVQDVRTGTRQP